jgi:hypothetical protein
MQVAKASCLHMYLVDNQRRRKDIQDDLHALDNVCEHWDKSNAEVINTTLTSVYGWYDHVPLTPLCLGRQ